MKPKLIKQQNGMNSIFITNNKFIIPSLYIWYLILKLGAKLKSKNKTFEASWYEVEINSELYELSIEQYPFEISLRAVTPASSEKLLNIYDRYFKKIK